MIQSITQNRRGSILLAVAYTGLLGASVSILSNRPDLTTRTGRHLVAGALAIAALTLVEILICTIPLRKGEAWAHWAAAVPFFVLGIPIFIIGASFGPPQTRVATLLPQGVGILLGILLAVRFAAISAKPNDRISSSGSCADFDARQGEMMKHLLRCLLFLPVVVPVLLVAQRAPQPDVDPRIEMLVASVSEDRLRQLAERLTSFSARNTMSDQASSARGIGAARQWIFDELKRSSPRLTVSFDTYQVAAQGRILRDVELRNVMAVLPGKSPRRIYISGHYDSVNVRPGGALDTRPVGQPAGPDLQLQPGQDFNIAAPGANDDGSGTALTMELARVFAQSGIDFDATVVFMCWAGEEQGLIGSSAHAQRIAAEKIVVEANFNNDIVGNSRGGNGVVDAESVRVYSVGPEDSMSRSLARYVERAAAIYIPSLRIRLMAREDRFGRGSDHSSFSQSGYPAIVFREANENFAKQHSAGDTIDGNDFRYLAQNARANAASAASLALAPPAPKVTNERGANLLGRGPSGYDASLAWNASPGAVAYRIYWRDSWTNDWQRQQTVGNVTQFMLANVSIDDFVFGVAAIGADGHESLVRAYVTPDRRLPDVKVIK